MNNEKIARLDARLVAAGVGSRKDMQKAIRGGRVRIADTVITDTGCRQAGALFLDDMPLREPPITIIMHKPDGLACSHQAREAPLVFDLLPAGWPEYQTIGRLDRDTTGLLLLTLDGTLNHRLAAPKHAVTKEYQAVFDGTLVSDAVEQFAAGLTLDDGPCRPAQLRLTGPQRATVVLSEGRFHQVKRMLAAVGGTVTALHRQRIGDLLLPPDLEAGAWRAATAEEISEASEASGENTGRD